jgi:hypothetical protein
MSRRARLALALVLLLAPAAARAQDFASPWPFWPPGSALALLEHGLAGPAPRASAEAAVTRWFGLPQLETRAIALGGRAREVSFYIGFSQTGAPELGWTSLAAGIGRSDRHGGVAVRALARRDRLTPFAFDGDAHTTGDEAGIGAWARAGGTFRVWMSAPQLWRDGEAPPLRRSLTLGAVWTAPGAAAWFARESVVGPTGARHGEHEAGVALGAPGASLWCSVRDRPVRVALGVSASRGLLGVAGSAASHPVLAQTTQLGVRIADGPAR